MTLERALLAGILAGIGLPFVLAAASAACGNDPYTFAPLGEGGVAETSTLDAPTPIGRDARAPTDHGTLAAAPTVEIADTACKPRGGTPIAVDGIINNSSGDGGVEAGDAGAPPASIGPVVATVRIGTRRAAQLTGSGGVLLFDADGANASSTPVVAGEVGNVVASEGTALGVAAYAGNAVRYARFDAQGQAVGAPLIITTEVTSGMAIAGGGGRALVVWSSTDAVRARVVRDGVVAAAPFDIASKAATTFFTATAVSDGADGFGVAWSGSRGPSAYELRFGHARDGSADVPDVELLTSKSPYSVVQVARTADGYALLYNAPGSSVFVARLDGSGKPLGPLMRLAGATLGWGIAAQGSEIGVVARRSTGEIQFRSFAANGAALGDWVCFEPSTGDPDLQATIDSDPVGYAVVYRSSAHTNSLVRLDRLGTGP
jgi:hypothetical protein